MHKVEMEVSIWSLNWAGCPKFLLVKPTKSMPMTPLQTHCLWTTKLWCHGTMLKFLKGCQKRRSKVADTLCKSRHESHWFLHPRNSPRIACNTALQTSHFTSLGNLSSSMLVPWPQAPLRGQILVLWKSQSLKSQSPTQIRVKIEY